MIRSSITDGRMLARNSMVNLIGRGLPLVAILIVTPRLVNVLGIERLGILAFIWTILAYFGVSDMGIGFVTTRMVAEALGSNNDQRVAQIPNIIWNCVYVLISIGFLLLILFIVVAPWLVLYVFQIPDGLKSEALNAFYIIAAAMPAILLTTTLRGVLEAYQQFPLSNIGSAGIGVLNYVGILCAALIYPSLTIIAFVLITIRLLFSLLYVLFCIRLVSGLSWPVPLDRKLLREIIHLSSWMTIFNILAPIFEYGDRFVIASRLTMASFAYYSIPYELVTKLNHITGSITSVVTPALCSTYPFDRSRSLVLFDMALKLTFCTMFVVTFIVFLIAPELLSLWIGPVFSQNAARSLQYLSLSVFYNSIGIVALSLIFAVGRQSFVVKIHLIEIPVYFALMIWLVVAMGIQGAAIAWAVRMGTHTIILLWFARSLFPGQITAVAPLTVAILTASLAFAGALIPWSFALRLGYGFTIVCTFTAMAWVRLFSHAEKTLLRQLLTKRLTAESQ